MVKPINMFKNPEQAKILRTKTEPVVIKITEEVKQLVEDLIDTCKAHPNCAGLSSNQIWDKPSVPPSVFVMKIPGDIVAIINPEIDKQWKKELKENEGCMSFPGVVKKVVRPRHIAVSYYDVNGQFYQNIDLFDFATRVFMHEYDHLQGILIEDK